MHERTMDLTPSKASSEPKLFSLSRPADTQALEELFARGDIRCVIDEYRSQLSELYAIEHPAEAFSPAIRDSTADWIASLEKEQPLPARGIWAYFPWESTLTHILDHDSFQKVRTARNRQLITEEEQERYYDAVIGIAGLSVGSSVALAIFLQGGARHIKLADHDSLELSNLNRIAVAGIDCLGIPKVEMAARRLYALNPYAHIELFPEGLTEGSIGAFFDGLDMVVDEIDSLPMKFRIREEARTRKLPVLMAADNDRSGVIDVERHDAGSQVEAFNGRLPGITQTDVENLDKRGIGRTIAQLVGVENHTERMLQSLQAMGKTVVSWPQLGGTALLNGAAIAHCALRVANAQPLINDRAIISLDAALDADHFSEDSVRRREEAVQAFRKVLGL